MRLQLKSKDNSKFTKEVVFNSVKNILSTNTAYKWVSTEEPFINNYGKLCFDKGSVRTLVTSVMS